MTEYERIMEALDDCGIYAEDVVTVTKGQYEGQEGFMDGAEFNKDGDLLLWICLDDGRTVLINADYIQLIPEKCSWY